ncbi:hypothetical protein VTN77DRAFT_1984 [Rasamsonia byssochlamydoides]|uniref:uncharacterized protein n=1 Tax=Rasamsonia byssochlamydoides TaxID=89139 RepID=UPI0037434867
MTFSDQRAGPGNRRKRIPRTTARRTLPSPSWTLKALLTAVVAVTVGLFLWLKSSSTGLGHYTSRAVDWEHRREKVKEAFICSWDAYTKYAWGQDRFHPLSKTGSQMSPDGLGWIIVDSLDTLMIMNLTSRLANALKWIHRKLTYDQDQDVNTFETTIRMLGGLLSAHYLSSQLPDVSSRRDHVYLSKAVDLADRLLGAYESGSGIPYASVNLREMRGIPSHADGGASSTAEAGTVQMEMKYLAHLTGKEIYWRKAEKVMKVLDDNGMEGGLLPIFVDPQSGRFTTREIRLGSRGDSYYEYLIKQYLQTSGQEPVYLEMWAEALHWNPKASNHLDETLKTHVRCRATKWHRRPLVSQDGPPRLLLARLHRSRCDERAY